MTEKTTPQDSAAMSDFDDQMAEWRKTLWATGPCPDSSPENFTLTDEEREAIERAVLGDDSFYAATLRKLLERLT